MKIALLNENSQAAKNSMIEACLRKVVEPMGHEVVNYGMYTADDACQLTYVKCGLLAGILCDTSSNVLFGFQSILYLLICTAVGLLVVYFMQPSVTNSLIFVGCGFAGRLLLEYFFYYAMWGYDNAYLILLQRMLPNLLYTLALTPLWFLLVRRLHRFFQEKLE